MEGRTDIRGLVWVIIIIIVAIVAIEYLFPQTKIGQNIREILVETTSKIGSVIKQESKENFVSLKELFENPEKYKNQTIRTQGYYDWKRGVFSKLYHPDGYFIRILGGKILFFDDQLYEIEGILEYNQFLREYELKIINAKKI